MLSNEVKNTDRKMRDHVVKKVKIVISIPFHEAIDVAIDQVNNIKKYVEDCIIVLHASKSLENNPDLLKLNAITDVFINPIKLETSWGEIIETHIANFEYAESNWDFEYFVMHSSNDMYVRKGLYSYICKYEAGFNHRSVENADSLWVVAEPARNDEVLNRLRGQNKAWASQIEGSFYSRELMHEIVNRLHLEMPFKKASMPYTREELFFSTMASKILKDQPVGKPTTFSEVHRFDNIYQKYYQKSNSLFKSHSKDKGKEALDKLVKIALRRSGLYSIRKHDIQQILKQNAEYIKQNGRIDDGQGAFFMYDGSNVFSVKRVPRSMKNSLRKYINQINEGID